MCQEEGTLLIVIFSHTAGVSLSPVVTFSAASLDVLDSFLVFPPVSADKPHGPGPGLEGSAVAGADTAGHLVGLDGAASVWLDVVISILFLLTIPAPAASRLPLTGLSATFSSLCNINNNQNSISGHNSVSDTGKITCHCDTKHCKKCLSPLRKKSICNRLKVYSLAQGLFILSELTFTAFLLAVLSSVASGAFAAVTALLLPRDALAPPALVVSARVPGPVHHGRVLLRIQGAARAHFVTVLGRLEEVDEFVVYINFLQTS